MPDTNTELLAVAFHPCLVGRRALPLSERIALAVGAGYDAVDLDLPALGGEAAAHGAPLTLSSARSAGEAAAGQLAAAGLIAGTAQLPVEFRGSEEQFRDGLASLPALAELAAGAGVHVLTRSIPPGSDQPAAAFAALLAGRLFACASIVEASGLRIAIEGLGPEHLRARMRHPFRWRLAEIVDLAAQCGPNVGVVADSWHWHHAGEDRAALAAAMPHVLAVHLADASRQPPSEVRDGQRELPGAGCIDLAGFASELRAARWHGTITPEVFDDERARELPPLARAQAVLAATRRALR